MVNTNKLYSILPSFILINPLPEAICSIIGPKTDSSNRVRLLYNKKISASLKFPSQPNSDG